MFWVWFALLASFLWAVTNIIDKHIISSIVRKPYIPLTIASFVSILIAMVVYFFKGIETISYFYVFLGIMTGIFTALTVVLYLYSISYEEISRVIPLFYFAPIYVAIFAGIFLGEVFGFKTYLGLGLMIVGAVLISTKDFRKIHLNKALWFMVFSSLMWSFQSILTKYLLDITDIWTIFFYGRVGIFIFVIPLFIIYFKDIQNMFGSRRVRDISLMSISGFIGVMGVLAFIIALSDGFVTLVEGLLTFQPLFVLILAIFCSVYFPNFVKEEYSFSIVGKKVVFIALIIVGSYLVI